ncbi:hypothetical protein B0H19DRAFT_222091 [Mycena capillaripes]|nr:hypothetical protein B0H19DRAFT_222091 [Mycena capillaripes]
MNLVRMGIRCCFDASLHIGNQCVAFEVNVLGLGKCAVFSANVQCLKTDVPYELGLSRVICPQASEHDGGKPNLAHPENRVENRVVYTSASFMPSSLHPYLHSGPNTSRSSQDITAHPITQESYSLGHLPAQDPTQSLQHMPALPPSPNLGTGGYLPSTNTSVIDFHLPGPATGSLSQARRSSEDITRPSFPPLLSETHPRIFPGTPESVRRYERKASACVFEFEFEFEFGPSTYPALVLMNRPNSLFLRSPSLCFRE